jgi:hypothetical protein
VEDVECENQQGEAYVTDDGWVKGRALTETGGVGGGEPEFLGVGYARQTGCEGHGEVGWESVVVAVDNRDMRYEWLGLGLITLMGIKGISHVSGHGMGEGIMRLETEEQERSMAEGREATPDTTPTTRSDVDRSSGSICAFLSPDWASFDLQSSQERKKGKES